MSTNPITPKQILTILSEDENSVIRANVTGHRRTPPEIIAKLVSEGGGHLKSLAAGNPSTPMETLKNLAKIQDGKVGIIARKTIAKLTNQE